MIGNKSERNMKKEGHGMGGVGWVVLMVEEERGRGEEEREREGGGGGGGWGGEGELEEEEIHACIYRTAPHPSARAEDAEGEGPRTILGEP